MSKAKDATGTLLKVGDGVASEGFTTIPEVSKLTIPKIKFDLHDVTSHDSVGGFREFLPGLADGESVTAELNWDPTDTVHQGVRDDSLAKTKRNFKLIFPTVAPDNTCSFSGYFTDISITANVGEPIKATVTIKVTGQPVWS
jgi:predicted secreted protein